MPPLSRRIPIPRSLLSSTTNNTRLTAHISRTHLTPLSQPRPSSQTQFQQRRLASDHADHGHESHYDQPGGWLWGIRPGEKYEKEGWENLMWYGFAGSWIVAIAVYAGKEDTSIQTWALEEARRRLEKEGLLEDPDAGRILEEPKN